MARGNLFAQTTREAPSAPMRETSLAPTRLPICCVCRLIRDKTGSSPDRERWVTPRTYRKTHGANLADFLLTHTYCPEHFTQVAQHRAKGGTMKYEPTQIISRIKWCRLQQQLSSFTPDERAGWRAEETGLVDALGCRDRIAFMREEHRSQFTRYQCGLDDGQALLRLSNLTPGGMTRMEGGPAPLTTWVNSRPSQAPRPVHVEFRR